MSSYTDAFARALVDQGIDTVFGVLGDANMYIGDRFAAMDGNRFIGTAHESGAVLMAAGYAAATDRVGAATVTHGAITNAVSALFDAARGRYPLLLVAGDTARSDSGNLQNLPHRDIVLPTGASFREVRTADTVDQDVADAVRIAVAERRPVVLGVPSDFQHLDSDSAPVAPVAVRHGILAPGRGALEELAAVVMAARRPVILAGRGARGPAAAAQLRALAERIGAPVATTLRGKGTFSGDPFDLGICGTLSTPPGLETIVASDCLIVFGAGLTPLTTMKGELLLGKRVVQIDADPSALGRFSPVELGVVADVETCARQLIELLDEVEAPTTAFRSTALRSRISAWHAEDELVRNPGSGLDIRDALHRINRVAPARRSLVVDAGRFAHEALRIMQVQDPSHYVHALNVAQIGMSLGYGVGAALGAADRPAVVVIGDGGFMLGGLAEFNTAVRVGADLIVFVINDGAYGAEYYRFVAEGLDASLTTFDWPDLAQLAIVLGGTGLTVRTLDDFAKVETALGQRDRPVLVDVILDRDAIPDPGAH